MGLGISDLKDLKHERVGRAEGKGRRTQHVHRVLKAQRLVEVAALVAGGTRGGAQAWS